MVCSACPIDIWREPGETLSKTRSIVQKRKTSKNGDLSPGKEKDRTWSRCPLPYKKAKVSEKFHKGNKEYKSVLTEDNKRDKKTSLVFIHGETDVDIKIYCQS